MIFFYISLLIYNIQNQSLLEDIIDFNVCKNKLYEMYYKYWMNDMQDPYEYKYWLISDIFAYVNNYNYTIHNYVPNFYNIFLRHFSLYSIKQINNYVYFLEKKEIDSQINIVLGLLNKKERKDLILNFPTLMDHEI